MSRLIDADKLPYIKAPIAPILVGDEVVWCNIVYKLHIDNAPTVDAVPVVRCRECEHGEYDDAIEDEYCYHCRYDGFSYNKADHFCSDGERKGGGERWLK